MTTETTTTEVKEPTPYEVAAEFVKNNAVSEITERIAVLTQQVKRYSDDYDQARAELIRWRGQTTEFVIDFVKSDDITTDDLKEFAEKMNIELTKEIEVTFKVDVKFTATVPLDFDVDKIDESDFDVRVDYRGNDDDIEMNEEYVDTEDFEVSEDN
jgi:uncharacterized small protein (DUF1192 family)